MTMSAEGGSYFNVIGTTPAKAVRGTISRVCRVCGAALDETNTCPSYLRTNCHICRVCNAKESNEWRANNREHVVTYRAKTHNHRLAYNKEYYTKNRRYIVAYRKKHYAEHPEYFKEYRAKNRKHIVERDRNYYIKNRDHITVRTKEWYAKNRPKILEYHRKYNANNEESIRRKNQQFRLKLKTEVLAYYSGGGPPTCARCGNINICALTIDHIRGGGTAQLKRLKIVDFYRWLKDHGYPTGYQVLCMNCQFRKRYENGELGGSKGAKNPAAALKTAKSLAKTKHMTFVYYSGVDPPACKCGETDMRALSIDHINGGGRKQGRGGGTLYHWLRKHNFPNGYQVLCMNCQAIKRIENGECRKKPRP